MAENGALSTLCGTPDSGTEPWNHQKMAENEEGCIRRAGAHDGLWASRCRPAGYKPIELSRFAVGIHPLVFESLAGAR
jgi:hypothetical protein